MFPAKIYNLLSRHHPSTVLVESIKYLSWTKNNNMNTTAAEPPTAKVVSIKNNTSEVRRAMSVRGWMIKFLSLFCHLEMPDVFGMYGVVRTY